MRNRLTELATSMVVLPAFTTLSATAICAQQQGQGQSVYVPPVMERRDADIARQREMRQTEILRLRLARTERTANLVYLQAIMAQVKQDFERIQVARNQIVRAAASGKELDYRFVSEVAGEIKKRASRLEDNLALPEPEAGEKSRSNLVELNETQIREALSTLCHRIESFVKSPLFENPGVLHLQHSIKATNDLASILELSGGIRKSAERLRKTIK